MIPNLRLYALAGALLVLLATIGTASFTAGVWSANSSHADEIRKHAEVVGKLNDEIADLKAAIAVQNTAVAVAEAQTIAAQDAQKQAEVHAEDLAKLSASRLAKLEQAVKDATTAGEVLQNYWELMR